MSEKTSTLISTGHPLRTVTSDKPSSISAGWTSLLTFIILALAWVASFSARLFAVIRFESIIHEFDPWFNYRATHHMVENGFYNFLNWFDERAWYPLGRIVGGTVFPGLMVTSGSLHYILTELLHFPVHIRDICVFLAPIFSGLTVIATFLLTRELWSTGAGLFAGCFIAIVPGYISRSVAGSYDNEGIAIFALMMTYFLWIRAVKTGSLAWAVLCALSYFYMVSAWGGYVYIINLVPLHVFVLLLMNRYSARLYVAYSAFFVVGLILSMQIPFVGFAPIRTSEHMASAGVFGLLHVAAALTHLHQRLSRRAFRHVVLLGLSAAVILLFLGLIGLTWAGYVAPWSGRFYSLWDTGYAKIHIPIIASVSEHQPTTWVSFFFDLHVLICVFPAGIWFCFRQLTDERVFIILYAVSAAYFAGVMVRLMLTLTPVVCVMAAIALSQLFNIYLKEESAGTSATSASSSPNSAVLSSPAVDSLAAGGADGDNSASLLYDKATSGGGATTASSTGNTTASSSHSSNAATNTATSVHRRGGKHVGSATSSSAASSSQMQKQRQLGSVVNAPSGDNASPITDKVFGFNVNTVVVVMLLGVLFLFVVHCTWVTSNAYSSPSVVLATYNQDGSRNILDDFREAYFWLRQNTEPRARVMSWWDYGYQIAGMANRTTLVDNNTWNNSHIALVGKAMSSNESAAYPIMRALDVDYVLVIFGGVIGYSGDDINKFLWMVRIAEGEHPKDIREADYFTANGEYRVDSQAAPAMLDCMMYKMSYHKFGQLQLDYRTPPGFDRTRNSEIGRKNYRLRHIDEVFTSEHWLVRIYRVKPPANRIRIVRTRKRLRRPASRKTVGNRRGTLNQEPPSLVKGRRVTNRRA